MVNWALWTPLRRRLCFWGWMNRDIIGMDLSWSIRNFWRQPSNLWQRLRTFMANIVQNFKELFCFVPFLSYTPLVVIKFSVQLSIQRYSPDQGTLKQAPH